MGVRSNSEVPMEMLQPHALTLDAAGVLLVPDPVFLRRALAPFDTEPDDETCWRAHYEMIHLLDTTSDPDYAAMNRLFAAALGVPMPLCEHAGRDVAEVYVGRPWIAAPGAAEALTRLVDGGYRLAVVSNSMHGQMEQLLLKNELCSTAGVFAPVTAIIDSQLVGVRKPDPRIFRMAVSALAAEPSCCVHVGDSVVDDVIGARAAGLTPVHIDPLGSCLMQDHVHAPSLLELANNLAPS